MRARLFGRYGPCRGLQFDVAEEAVIGRGEDSDVVIERGPVSKTHARLQLDPETDRYWLEDLDSLNGTEVDGERVRTREPLSHLHVLSFGGCELIFQDLVRCAQRHPLPAPAPEAALGDEVPEPAGASKTAAAKAQGDDGEDEDTFADSEPAPLPGALAGASSREAASEEGHREGTIEEEGVVALPSFLSGAPSQADAEPASGKTMRMERVPAMPEKLRAPSEDADQGFQLEVDTYRGRLRFPLAEGEHVIGRGAGCDIQLEIESLSRRHARLVVAPERVTICDLGSRNGTFVDGEAVEREEVEIAPHQDVVFGITQARLVRMDGEGLVGPPREGRDEQH